MQRSLDIAFCLLPINTYKNNTTDGETNLNYFKLKRWKFEMFKTFSCHNNEGQAKERETDG